MTKFNKKVSVNCTFAITHDIIFALKTQEQSELELQILAEPNMAWY